MPDMEFCPYVCLSHLLENVLTQDHKITTYAIVVPVYENTSDKFYWAAGPKVKVTICLFLFPYCQIRELSLNLAMKKIDHGCSTSS